jgi:DCN1-like protein 1/2
MPDPMDIDRSLCKLFISNMPTRFFQSGSSGGGGGVSTASKSTLNKLFDKYRDDVANEPDEIGIEGTMKLLEDMDISPDDVGALILSEMVKSPSLGKLTRTEFVDSLAALG